MISVIAIWNDHLYYPDNRETWYSYVLANSMKRKMIGEKVTDDLSTGWSKATVTNNISMTNLKNTKNGLTQWFLESIYAAVLVFWCLKMIRWKKILHFSVVPKWWVCSARLNSAWTEASSNPQSSFDIPKYHPDTPSLSLRHPKTSPQHQTL